MLKRKFYSTLLHWKQNHGKEGLLVKGARQIGKTYIIDYFARENYDSYLYVNFIDNPECRDLFSGSLQADDIFRRLSGVFQAFKLIPGKTVLFLDEIQNCPRARTAFKPLALDGRVDVIGSGSLLGLSFLNDELKEERQETSIPVGYERQMMMYSLDFEEFLWALGYRPDVIADLHSSFVDIVPIDSVIHDKMNLLFREYIAIGGMPQVVNRFIEENSYSAAFEEQTKVIASNLDDIARYAPNVDKPKIRACYLSLPNHLARENKKFKYADVGPGGSSRKFGGSIDWLRESALVLQCNNLERVDIPLNVYRENDCFKLYASDVGTLTGMMGFPVKHAIVENSIKDFAKGGLYENALIGQLVRKGYAPCYFRPRSNQAEVDFVIEGEEGVVPIEVKSSKGSSPSFDRLLEQGHVPFGYKFTSGNLGRVGKKITLPHYLSMFI